MIRPCLNLNATYSTSSVSAGSLAIVTQSASLGAAILDWAEPSGVGFSAVLSTGSDTDVSLSDLLDLLSEDHHTKAIIVYLDHVRQTRSFLSAISAAARIKPVVLMKSTQDAARFCDALARTGQVYSTEHVFQTAMRRAGKGKRLAIISNGAAPAMLACERIATKEYLLPELSDQTLAVLQKNLGKNWTGHNPIVLRDAENLSSQYEQSLIALKETRCTQQP